MTIKHGLMPFPSPALGPSELAVLLQEGSAALFPTDTLPALATSPGQANQLWRLKKRPADKPLILMAASSEVLFACLGTAPRFEWLEMAAWAWPGSVTLVLPALGEVAEALNPGGSSLGLRLPASAEALSLLQLSGPLATTSANISGCPAACTAQEAAQQFPGVPLLAPLPWPLAAGQASTVVAWRAGGGWRVVRAGALLPPGI
ncbi:MAG: L-threonylcarbamoyladenylate synthase [Cyanobacteria bacterium]|nr:L-threonylcarbamoyladenylate synthase [Cyanobacteriota bacterium]MDA1246646.1 L-threonylcarbamoyladenylate synthase [Cyanobacteriota bacterium]